jgi:rubredoxin
MTNVAPTPAQFAAGKVAIQRALEDDGVPNIQHQHDGIVRTTMNCHACAHAFLALIDYDVGRDPAGSAGGTPGWAGVPLQIHCPYCGHKHGRRILDGVMTEDRAGPGDSVEAFQAKVKVWKLDQAAATAQGIPPARAKELAGKVATSTTSEFLRHRWLNLVQGR